MKTKPTDSMFTPAMREQIAALIERIGDDGHTVWKPEVLDAFPPAVRARHTRTYESDGSPKGSLTTNAGPVDELRGVYGLHVLGAICSNLGLEAEGALGRGTQARKYTAAIRAWLAAPVAPATVELVAAVLMLPDGEKRPVAPADGRAFTMAEAQGFVGGHFEVLRLTEARLMLLNEEGKLLHLPANPAATALAQLCRAVFPGDCICGPALVCDASQFE